MQVEARREPSSKRPFLIPITRGKAGADDVYLEAANVALAMVTSQVSIDSISL